MAVIRVDFAPTSRDSVGTLSATLATGMVTLTLQLAVNPPSLLVAMTTAVPAPVAVTLPIWSTIATLGLLLLHDT
jgi:multisubunit Na+/H+ antiporter MnhG subunit